MTTSRIAHSAWKAPNVFTVVLEDYFPAYMGTGLVRVDGVQRDVSLHPVGARKRITNEFELTFSPMEGVTEEVAALPVGTPLYLALE